MNKKIWLNALITLIFLQLTGALAENAKLDPTNKSSQSSQPVKAKNPIWRIETNKGAFSIELLASDAPITVKNFIDYAESGFYNGTTFHRVIPGFVLQGGGFDKNMMKKKTRKPIINESSVKIKNLRGTLSMARLSAPDTATSQFFINLQDNRQLDKSLSQPGYAVFAKITEGMFTIEQISYKRTGTIGIHKDVPLEPIEIISVTEVSEKETAVK